MAEGASIVLSVVFSALALFLMIWFYILLPAGMAKRRSRRAVL